MKKVRLYIADMDEGFVAAVRAALSSGGDVEIVGASGDGCRALREVAQLAPDVLLAETSLPGLDGIALLKAVRRLKRPPVVLVCSGFYSSVTIDCARRYGAALFLCKPVEMAALRELIQDCRRCAAPTMPDQSADGNRRAAAVRALLKQLGIPARLSGSAYLVEAVAQVQVDALLMKNLTRGLYPALARRMDTTATRVERALRSAISVGYERGALQERMRHKPTNKEFIEYVLRAVDELEAGNFDP